MPLQPRPCAANKQEVPRQVSAYPLEANKNAGGFFPYVPYRRWQILKYRSKLTIVMVVRLPQPKKKPAQP